MNKITEREFAKICNEIYIDRETIFRHNPIGAREERVLWMLLSCLTIYMSLSEIETPCFSGTPTMETYREAILFILKIGKAEDFDAAPYLDKLVEE